MTDRLTGLALLSQLQVWLPLGLYVIRIPYVHHQFSTKQVKLMMVPVWRLKRFSFCLQLRKHEGWIS